MNDPDAGAAYAGIRVFLSVELKRWVPLGYLRLFYVENAFNYDI